MKRALVVLAACSSTAAPITNGGHATAPPGAAALVLFEPAGMACVLARVDPLAQQREELARFPNGCQGARIAWRPDHARAVVWFEPEDGSVDMPLVPAAAAPHLYDVDIAAHVVAALDIPPQLAEAAYGTNGVLYAFVEQDLPNAKGMVTVRGTRLDFTQISEGMPAAALAFARRGGRWELVSVTATTTGWDYARGWSAAPEADHLGPHTSELLDAHLDTKPVDRDASAALERIARSQAEPGDAWAQAGPLYIWMFSGELVYTTGRIAWRDASGAIALLPELGLTEKDPVAVLVRGRYLLVVRSNYGTGARLYDLTERRRIYASDTAFAVTFWPP